VSAKGLTMKMRLSIARVADILFISRLLVGLSMSWNEMDFL
jgi:hypothetical protein